VSFLGGTGGPRRAGAALLRHRLISATAGTAAAVIVAGCAFAASSGGAHQEKIVNAGNGTQASPSASAKPTPAEPLRLLSVTPAGGTKEADGGAPITLTFSAPLAPATPLPTLSPKVAGNWKVSGTTATFTPSAGFLPGTKVKVSVPGGTDGMTAAASSVPPLAKAATVRYTTGSYSTQRLQQVLAELGYLPLTWTADSGSAAPGTTGGSLNEQVSEAYDPPSGTFTFDSGYPIELTRQWKAGTDNELVVGAIRAFESVEGLAMDGDAGPAVWSHLLTAAAKDEKNPNGYSYALATQGASDESLQVWHNGKKILDTPANTGIAAAPTADGTYPVYDRLQFQVMKGKNPDGTKYADPVYWISYFNGGDAVHGFVRSSYGWYQSLGCVELPVDTAQSIWPSLTYGTLVTVQGPVA
jgi:lipoprotein-anchoring transpeptidase ErfK/SrfK